MAWPKQRCSCRTIPTFLIDILLSDLENLGFALQIPMNCVYREKQQHLRSTTTVTQMKFRISYSIFIIVVREAPNMLYLKLKVPKKKEIHILPANVARMYWKVLSQSFLSTFITNLPLGGLIALHRI